MITTKQMRKLEELSEQHGVSRARLMENAGKAAFDIIRTSFNTKSMKALVVCYHGNNGGDGFVLARHLMKEHKTDVLFLGEEKKLKEEARAAWDRLDKSKVKRSLKEASGESGKYTAVIDALLGTGTKGKIKEPVRSAISFINSQDATIISLDVPSGIDPDTGESQDIAVEPSLIITFHDAKKGLKRYENRTIIADIGIPREAIIRHLRGSPRG